MHYEIEVRPGPGTGHFQYYTETVEALTSHDALAMVQRRNPGCQVTVCRSWQGTQRTNSRSGSSSDCFIATAAYGSSDNNSVHLLRYWRDRCLLSSRVGATLVAVYYRLSPPIADAIRHRPALQLVVRQLLRPCLLVASLSIKYANKTLENDPGSRPRYQ